MSCCLSQGITASKMRSPTLSFERESVMHKMHLAMQGHWEILRKVSSICSSAGHSLFFIPLLSQNPCLLCCREGWRNVLSRVLTSAMRTTP